MKCPNCKTEMEKGYVYAYYGSKFADSLPLWWGKEEKPSNSDKKIISYKCKNCHHVELFTEEEKQ